MALAEHDLVDIPAPAASTPTLSPVADDPAGATPEPSVAHAVAQIWHNPDVLTEARVARSAVVGAAIGIVAFILCIGGLALWVGLDTAPALGLGVFTAFWGGLGFGGMVGGVRAVNRIEAERLTG